METKERLPRPWRVITGKVGEKWIVSDGIAKEDSRYTESTYDHYGGELVCEGCTSETAEYIAQACNNFDELKQTCRDLLNALQDVVDVPNSDRYWKLSYDAEIMLEKLVTQ